MGTRTEHAPGTFSWVDLGTTDSDSAKAFYSGLFGWEPEDMPAGDGVVYTMLKLDGESVCALYDQPAEMRERGVPPTWLSYVTVQSADDTAARAGELGGQVHAEPFDVLQAGRMTLLQDPTGAMLAAWQPRESIGATRVNDPGCLTWNELATGDMDAAATFYDALFGWETEQLDTGPEGPPYAVIRNDGRMNGGMTALGPQHGDAPPHWLAYFTARSTDDTAAKAGELGGQVLAGPLDVPKGRIAVILDQQGAAFGLFQGETDD
jgi:predicted enzyme related to lactoylglutathione lyase